MAARVLRKENHAMLVHSDLLGWCRNECAEEKFAAWALSEESSAREKLPSAPDVANEPSSREKKLNLR